MKNLCLYFVDRIPSKNYSMSLSGKLEAFVGNYCVSGAGAPDELIYTVYYDNTIDYYYNAVECKEENLIAYVTADYQYAFVLETMLKKFYEDTREYNMNMIPVRSFDEQEFYVENTKKLPDFMSNIRWINDDFLNDDQIEFDYEAFELIDSGIDYLNPAHFSIKNLINYIKFEELGNKG